MSQRLLDVERIRRPKWTGSVALVILDRDHCLRCRSETVERRVAQPALLRHGGYGATKKTTFRFCPECRWFFISDVTEVRPERVA